MAKELLPEGHQQELAKLSEDLAAIELVMAQGLPEEQQQRVLAKVAIGRAMAEELPEEHKLVLAKPHRDLVATKQANRLPTDMATAALATLQPTPSTDTPFAQ